MVVTFDNAQISLASLQDMLASNKAHFPEGHRRITEIRDAIEQAHQKRCHITEPATLIQQTERNIASKARAIDKCAVRIADLKSQRDEIDAQIASEETKLKNEQGLLETFRLRLEEAKVKQQATSVATGVLPSELDPEPGMPTLRRWLQANYIDLFTSYEQMQWKQQIARCHADLFANWSA